MISLFTITAPPRSPTVQSPERLTLTHHPYTTSGEPVLFSPLSSPAPQSCGSRWQPNPSIRGASASQALQPRSGPRLPTFPSLHPRHGVFPASQTHLRPRPTHACGPALAMIYTRISESLNSTGTAAKPRGTRTPSALSQASLTSHQLPAGCRSQGTLCNFS